MSDIDEHKTDFAIRYGSARQHHKILDDEYTYGHQIRDMIQQNPHKEILGRIAHEDHHGEDIHQAVADHTTHPEHLDHLMHSPYKSVREAVATNHHAQPHHLDHLMKDEEDDVVYSVAGHHNLQPHQVEHLTKHSDVSGVLNQIGRHHPSSHDALINHPHNYPRETVAQYTKKKEHLDKLVHDPVADVRYQVASNRHATDEHHKILMNDHSVSVRTQVAKFTKSHEIANHLLKDSSLNVKYAAENKIQKLADKEHQHKMSRIRASNGIHDPERDPPMHIHFKDHPEHLAKFGLKEERKTVRKPLIEAVIGVITKG